MAQGTCDGAPVLGKHNRWTRGPSTQPPSSLPQGHQAAERGPTNPQPTQRPLAVRRPQRGVAQPHHVLLDPGGLGPHLLRCVGGRALQARHQQAGHRGPRGRGKGSQPDAPAMAPGRPARARATHRAPILVCPSHLRPQRRLTAQGGLGGIPGHRPTEHIPGPQPRPAHSRRS